MASNQRCAASGKTEDFVQKAGASIHFQHVIPTFSDIFLVPHPAGHQRTLSLSLCVAPKLLSGFRINFLAVCSWMVGYFQVPQVHEASAAVPC